jgi:SAM-dependent methyltransferase
MTNVQSLVTRFYPNYRSESERLHDAMTSYLRPDSVVLDLGCGGGKLFPRDYRAPGRRVVGVDLDPAIRENPLLDERHLASIDDLPLPDASVDLVYSRYVMEHVERPEAVFAEVARVLRPGGVFIVLTPNLRHYVSAISRLTPEAFHKFFNARARGRRAEDTFPTAYRANTPAALRALARGAGMAELELRMIETRPNYLMWATLPFLAGVAYERLVNSTELLKGFRVNILGVYGRPGMDVESQCT